MKHFKNFPLGKKRINLILVAMVIIIFIKFTMILGDSKPKEELGFAVNLNFKGDFPNPREGTAIFNIRLLMDQIILNYQKVPKYVIFTESKTIPGLILRYNVHDSVFEGGIPLMRSEEVVFLDNNIHEIAYTFKKGAEQKIFFDGREVASGNFDSDKIGITGFVVLENYEIKTIPVDGSAEFR